MADFLERYAGQLHRAQLRRRRRRVTRATFLAVVTPAVIAVAVVVGSEPDEVERPALRRLAPVTQVTPVPTPSSPPAVGTWTPPVGRPEKGLKAKIDRAPLPQAVLDAFAVLRRPQTERDRNLVKPRLRYFGGQGGGNGLQVDAARALTKNFVLVPVQSFGFRKDAGPALCLAGSGGVSCTPIDSVAANGVSFSMGGKRLSAWIGVVPDTVATVRFTPETGRAVEYAVRDNFYEIRIHTNTSPGRVDPPPGWKGPKGKDGKIDGPPMPVNGKLEWLAADGKVVEQRRSP